MRKPLPVEAEEDDFLQTTQGMDEDIDTQIKDVPGVGKSSEASMALPIFIYESGRELPPRS